MTLPYTQRVAAPLTDVGIVFQSPVLLNRRNVFVRFELRSLEATHDEVDSTPWLKSCALDPTSRLLMK